MKRIIFLLLFVFVYISDTFAQINDFTKNKSETIFQNASVSGWIKFNTLITTDATKVFEQYKNSFNLDGGYGMQLKKINQGENGYKHYRFEQTFNGIKVEYGEYTIHTENNILKSGNGKIYTPSITNTTLNISEEYALSNALKYIAAQKYAWQDTAIENRLKKRKKSTSSYYPKAEKIFCYNEKNQSLDIVYKFYIRTVDAGKSCFCYVSAKNGEVIFKTTTEYFCDQASVNTNWYSNRTIFTKNVGVFTNSYNLEDDCQASIYTVYNVYTPSNTNNIFNTSNNFWNSSEIARSGGTCLWATKQTYQVFKSIFNREGHDNNGADLDIYNRYNFGTVDVPNYNNASYSYDETGIDEIRFGPGDDFFLNMDDWNALDVVAHEFTHGVTQYEANLVYSKEPGALNESFSDIFGEYVERVTFGSANWLVGWDRLVNGTNSPIRSMIDPNNMNDPNTYLGSNWINTNTNSIDNYGVHTNSGVQNQMAYLLSVGGAGWNNGQTCHAAVNDGYFWSVQGIGIAATARIAYKALNDYLGTNSNYNDARNAWVHAAIELYGSCSFEAIQTGKAWYAVGIGSPAPATLNICGNIGVSFPDPNYIYNNFSTTHIINTSPFNCGVNIASNASQVNLRSGNKVTLFPGFRAVSGSNFTATIADGCEFANY